MNKGILTIGTVLIILILSYTVMATKLSSQDNVVRDPLEQNNKVGTSGVINNVPNKISGHIFSGNYLRVGINNFGTLGVTNGYDTNDPGVGFQSARDTPFQWPSTESVATGWWGEGYNIAYDVSGTDKISYWQPGYGYPCAACNIVPISNRIVVNNSVIAVKEVKVKTRDSRLIVTFTFTLAKEYPSLKLQTIIKNNGSATINRIVYKRIIDWDVCCNNANTWSSTNMEASALGICPDMKPTLLTISGYGEMPGLTATYVDLDAWDDQAIRSPMHVLQRPDSILRDSNVGIYYDIGRLNPGESKIVYTTYQSDFPKII